MTEQQQNDNHLDLDAMIMRIQKLLALADPNANDSQAQITAAMAKVTELLQKYDMTLEQVQAYERQEADSGITEDKFAGHMAKDVLRKHILVKDKWTDWFVDLATAVAAVTNCKPLTSQTSATFIGFKRDVELATYLFSSLFNRLVEAAVAATLHYTQDYSRKYHANAMLLHGEQHPWNWRRSWLEGAVHALYCRLYDSIREQRKQQTVAKSQALVVLDTAIETYVKQSYPKLDTLKNNDLVSSNGAMDAWELGHMAGNAMPIQPGLNSPNTLALK